MLRTFLRLLLRIPALLLSSALMALVRLRLGRRGVLELTLDGAMGHPLAAAAQVEAVARQSGARGLLIRLEGPAWGWATAQEWRAMLERLRADGLLIVVFAPSLDNRGALVAAAADCVAVPPLADYGLVGVSAEMTFFGGLLERLGVRADVEAAGEYKSLGEPFTRRWASAANREAMGALVDDLQAELVEGVAAGRRLEAAAVEAAMAAAPLSAEEAKAAGFVDEVLYEDGLGELLEGLLGAEATRAGYRGISRLVRWASRLEEVSSSDPMVAVVHLEGAVTMGGANPRGQPQISVEDTLPVLQALRHDPRVDAVVLSVNSPGGSALASDLIWREVELLVREKPVVAHFSDVSASGGYYLAAAANAIIARPTTLTGSIGVVGFKLVVGQGAGKLGVHSEAVERGPNAGLFSPMRPFDDSQRAAFRRRLAQTYEVFVKRVAAGRKAPYEDVERVARGRVWAGRSALEVGLVDGLGGLDEAFRRAKALAGVRPAQRILRRDLVVRPPRPLWMRFLPGVSALPGGGASATVERGIAELGLPSMAEAEALMAEVGQPLALLPVQPRLR